MNQDEQVPAQETADEVDERRRVTSSNVTSDTLPRGTLRLRVGAVHRGLHVLDR